MTNFPQFTLLSPLIFNYFCKEFSQNPAQNALNETSFFAREGVIFIANTQRERKLITYKELSFNMMNKLILIL